MIDGIFEEVWKVLMRGVFGGAKQIGLFILKILSSNNDSREEFREKYKGSIIPYLIGFSLYFGIFYLIIKLFS